MTTPVRRLTLRTLLAYLDDTLPASEIKDFGEKVAESDAAQELIARIKQVTRRRRLTVPPATGPSGIDPNDVAAYLDDVLPGDQVVELEKLAHESDVHLAEIASCHQILTLVLGEPALVPPKARERMYRLVQGREALPHRKAQPVKNYSTDVLDHDDIGLSSRWLGWVLPVAGILLVVALGLAVYQVIPDLTPKRGPYASNGDPQPGNGEAKPSEKNRHTPIKNDKESEKPIKNGKSKPINKVPPEKDPVEKDPPEKGPQVVVRPAPPSTQRVGVGTYSQVAGLPTALVVNREGKDGWERLSPGSRVFTADKLVSLPGFASVIRTSSGVGLLMRGSLREFALSVGMVNLLESAVVLHHNDSFDLDLTLQRGRIFLTNRKEKGPCKIRLRFEGEVWDLTLEEPGDEVGVDLTKSYTALINYRAGEEPQAECYVAVLRGDVGLKIDAYQTYNIEVEPPKWAWMGWSSVRRTQGPFREQRVPESWNKQPPPPELLQPAQRENLNRMQQALKQMELLLDNPRKSLAVAFKESQEKTDPASRVLAIYCMGAIDEVPSLVEALGDEDRDHQIDREAAFFTLQRWISRGPQQSKVLYDEKNGTGVLIDKRYKKAEAQAFTQLLHPFMADQLSRVDTYEFLAQYALQHRKVAIAEMGFWHLVWLSGGAKLPGGFNAAAPFEDREKYAALIQKMIDNKQLPPRPQEKPEEK